MAAKTMMDKHKMSFFLMAKDKMSFLVMDKYKMSHLRDALTLISEQLGGALAAKSVMDKDVMSF